MVKIEKEGLNMLERVFKLNSHKTDVKTEIMAGFTTFMTMAYILAVNPSILANAGMDPTAVLLATCIASFIGTFLMAVGNLPFAISAGMGLNAFLAYTIVQGYGFSWQLALFAVFIEGIIFIIMSITNVREAIFDAIPPSLKVAISVGIGLFIAFIGLQNSGLVVSNSSTLISIVNFTENFNTAGICACLALIGLIVTAVLYIKKVKGSILIGILATWMLGIICELTGIYVPNAIEGYASLIPALELTDFSKLSLTFAECFKFNFSTVRLFDFMMVILAFLFVDVFDTVGTLIALSTKAELTDKNGKFPKAKVALMADAIATTIGAILGTSTTSTYVESSSGIMEGGRTGLTALTVACLFLLSMFFAPLFIAIPSFATAPALIIVGFLMFSSISEIKWNEKNYTTAIPAYLTIIAMPLFYSISDGIAIGIISFVIIHLLTGKRKDINALLYVLAVLFILKYAFL